MIQGSSWFIRDSSAGQGAQARAIQRICARLALSPGHPHPRIRTADLPLGGVQVWVEADSCPPQRRWAVLHRMAREISLTGWHTEIGAGRIMVLGWSASCLDHRARVLRTTLARRLTDRDRTAALAIRAGTRLLARYPLREDPTLTTPFPSEPDPTGGHLRGGDDYAVPIGYATPDDGGPRFGPAAVEPGLIAAAAVAAVAGELRWPARLAGLDGLERTSSLDHLQNRLAQVAGLESAVSHQCAEHLDLAWQVACTLVGLMHDGRAPLRPPGSSPAGWAGWNAGSRRRCPTGARDDPGS
ncbi:hypothetical protein OIE66_09325 [Nonomuraea sp. NBC_01738]|uniref:hypothetical protein n=1 Tax=Nonomuraea sp. NBC_01738 TaxID=2976003 RepID=UPI002E1356C2|nr:hypothetical protein OIE66_09325 [Nonomuraea sp. NBC_01738]